MKYFKGKYYTPTPALYEVMLYTLGVMAASGLVGAAIGYVLKGGQ